MNERPGRWKRLLRQVHRFGLGGSKGAPSERLPVPRRAVRRGVVGGCPYLAVRLCLPAASYPGAARALAGSMAAVCAGWPGTVGSVTVVPGEEPALVPLAAHTDVVATRVLEVLTRGESHRTPHLLALLAPGVYLGQVIDPYAPFDVTLETMAELTHPPRVPLTARLTVQGKAETVEVEVVLVAPDRQALRRALTRARERTRSPMP